MSVRGSFEATVSRHLSRVHRDDRFAAVVRDAALAMSSPVPVIPRERSHWSLSDGLARVLCAAVDHERPASVLELGAGWSTAILAQAMQGAGGGRLTSVEESPHWCAEPLQRVATVAGVDHELVVARPRRCWTALGLVYVYARARARVAARGPHDLVVIDAPQYWLGRDGAMPLVHAHLGTGALVLLDDAGRAGERGAIYRWLRTYPGLRLVHYDADFDGRGLAALRVVSREAPRRSLLVTASATRLALAAPRRAPS